MSLPPERAKIKIKKNNWRNIIPEWVDYHSTGSDGRENNMRKHIYSSSSFFIFFLWAKECAFLLNVSDRQKILFHESNNWHVHLSHGRKRKKTDFNGTGWMVNFANTVKQEKPKMAQLLWKILLAFHSAAAGEQVERAHTVPPGYRQIGNSHTDNSFERLCWKISMAKTNDRNVLDCVQFVIITSPAMMNMFGSAQHQSQCVLRL